MSNRYHGIAAFSLTLAFLALFYGEVLISPGNFMFSETGDGIKNYFTLAWYLEHNEDWLWFEGMNYPNKELLPYTDAQPALAWLFRLLGIDGATGVGLINWFMLVSVAVAAWVYEKLVKEVAGSSWWGVGLAVLMALTSPQIGRLAGHYSLAYIFVVPLFVLLIFRLSKGQSIVRNAIGLGVLGLVMGFIHPYVLLMQMMFGGLVWGCVIVRERFRFQLKRDIPWLASLLTPVILVQGFMALVDTKIDRPDDPWGFWVFQGDFRSVFAPQNGLLRKLTSSWFNYNTIDWETVAFVGSASLIFVIAGVIAWMLRRSKVNGEIWPSLIAGIILLFFSFGYPFKWFPEIADQISFIKNFRVLGRFSWPFVCVFGVFGFALVAQLKTKVKATLFVVAAILGTYESVEIHNRLAQKITGHPNAFADRASIANDEELLVDEHHAILPLPYFHVGSERIVKGSDDQILLESMKLSFATGLPLVASQMSRSSLHEAKDHLQILAPEWYHKPIVEANREEQWLLIIKTSECSKYERDLMKKSEMLAKQDGLFLASVKVESLSNREEVVAVRPSDIDGLTDDLFVEWSSGSRIHLTQEYTEALKPNKALGNYVFSCWYWNPTNARTETAVILEKVMADGTASWEAFETLDRAYAYSADSIRFELAMTLDDSTASYRILLKQPWRNPKDVYANHFLLAPEKRRVIRKVGDQVSVNNHKPVNFYLFDLTDTTRTSTFDPLNE